MKLDRNRVHQEATLAYSSSSRHRPTSQIVIAKFSGNLGALLLNFCQFLNFINKISSLFSYFIPYSIIASLILLCFGKLEESLQGIISLNRRIDSGLELPRRSSQNLHLTTSGTILIPSLPPSFPYNLSPIFSLSPLLSFF